MKEGKIAANHIIITGDITKIEYAKADFLSMHLEQHLQFGIKREGKLPELWSEHYKSVLTPLEITSPDIERGETTVYTREGRLIGNFDDFVDLMKVKYNIAIDYPDDRMEAIKKFHIETAKAAIADAAAKTFDEKVEMLLMQRQETLSNLENMLNEHKRVVNNAETCISEIDSVITYLKPTIDALYKLHHYPVPEETPEHEPHEEEEDGDAETTETENETGSTNDTNETETESKDTSDVKDDADNSESKTTTSTEEKESQEQSGTETGTYTESNVTENEEENKSEEQPDLHNAEEEEKGETETKEEEEAAEPDPEVVELHNSLKESFVLPGLPSCRSTMEDNDKFGLGEFLQDLEGFVAASNELIAQERFKWKLLETQIREFVEKSTLAKNMLVMSVISAETLQMKAIEAEMDNYDNFVIKDVDNDVLEAAAIKFAATFNFV